MFGKFLVDRNFYLSKIFTEFEFELKSRRERYLGEGKSVGGLYGDEKCNVREN